MTVRLDVNGALTPIVGPRGLEPESMEGLASETAAVRARLRERRAAGGPGLVGLPRRPADLREIQGIAEEARERFDRVVVLGTGASAAGPRALVSALAPSDGPWPRVVVSDDVDPPSVRRLLHGADPSRTLFNVVSKSGDTPETMARFLIVRDRLLRELGAVDYKRHIVVTTDARSGTLRQIVHDEGFRALEVPGDVEGPLAILSAVGLLPAALAGVDVEELLAGAAMGEARAEAAESPFGDLGLAFAGMMRGLAAQGGTHWVVASGTKRLGAFSDWLLRLWSMAAASGSGAPTAPRGNGTIGSHVPLQRVLEGPPDELVVFLRVEDHGERLDVPSAYSDLEEVGCLGGASLGTLVDAECQAAEIVLARQGRPSLVFSLPAVNAFTVGQLVQAFATAVAAVADGAPATGATAADEARRLAYGAIGRPGFDEERSAIEAWRSRRDPRFVF